MIKPIKTIRLPTGSRLIFKKKTRAYSETKQSGTGRDEPVLFTVNYGKGRIFHTVLGHACGEIPPPSMECAGFIVTFQRGAEWAAKGKVTLEVPGDFPATDKDFSTPDDVRRWKGFNCGKAFTNEKYCNCYP